MSGRVCMVSGEPVVLTASLSLICEPMFPPRATAAAANSESWQFSVGPGEGEAMDRTELPVSAVYCSREQGDCDCDGMVWFGIGGRYHKRHSTGNSRMKCISTWFEFDPTPGFVKNCWCETGAPPPDRA